MATLKLVDLNIEGDKHLPLVTEFLKSEEPDVVCLQEVLSKDVEYLKNLLNMEGFYAPTLRIEKENLLHLQPGNTWGVMILTNQKEPSFNSFFYAGNPENLPEFKDNHHNSDSRVLVTLELGDAEERYTIGTTHFTWSQGGHTSDLQRAHWESLCSLLDQYKSFVLTGDFNAPRGREIWANLAKRYKDNIPPNITTTVDQELHRMPGIQLVVDGLFSTPDYEISDVRVTGGVSDHMGISAFIKKITLL